MPCHAMPCHDQGPFHGAIARAETCEVVTSYSRVNFGFRPECLDKVSYYGVFVIMDCYTWLDCHPTLYSMLPPKCYLVQFMMFRGFYYYYFKNNNNNNLLYIILTRIVLLINELMFWIFFHDQSQFLKNN